MLGVGEVVTASSAEEAQVPPAGLFKYSNFDIGIETRYVSLLCLVIVSPSSAT